MGDVGVIGDSANDLPFLLEPGVKVAAAPSNAQSRVKTSLRALNHGLILDGEGLEGFLQFYRHCRTVGVRLIVADRDGVLRWKNDELYLSALGEIYKSMGAPDHPIVVVLTGSSAEQNFRFVSETFIDSSVAQNPKRDSLPPLIYAENGNVIVDIKLHSSHIREQSIAKNEADLLLGPVRKLLLSELEREVLPRFGMSFTRDPTKQAMCVFLPPKSTMLTVNVPKTFLDGRFFRDSPEAENFRILVGSAMESALRENGFEVERL